MIKKQDCFGEGKISNRKGKENRREHNGNLVKIHNIYDICPYRTQFYVQ